MVDKIMCSKLCPCPLANQQLWVDYGDEFLRKHSRVSSYDSLTVEEALDYDTNGENATFIPLYFTDSDTTYDKYERCYNLSFNDYLSEIQ
jgi:hypothetical protein